MLTQERVKELFDYNPDTGELIRRPMKVGSRWITGEAGGVKNKRGYVVIGIDKTVYYAHRIIWLYVNGYMPENWIDHINGNCSDNRLCNLREVSASCNIRNSRLSKANTSGVKGVRLDKRWPGWMAEIKINYKNHYIGCSKCFDESVCMRLAAEQCLEWEGCDSSSPAYQHVRQNITIHNKND